MSTDERPLAFSCANDTLIGILHPVAGPSAHGVLIVVGGPQYRAGSHRQFVELARHLAENGTPAMRFDTRGMGDSGGEFPGFEDIDNDIRAAVDAFFEAVPGLGKVVLWGLCDAASAILFYAHRDRRVVAAVLANPWVRTTEGLARTHIRHHYAGQLADPAFWRRLFSGQVRIGSAIGSFLSTLREGFLAGRNSVAGDTAPEAPDRPLPERMAHGLEAFDGEILLIMSGDDLTAREFDEAARSSPLWQKLLSEPRVTRKDIPGADHTFSGREFCNEVNRLTSDWVNSL